MKVLLRFIDNFIPPKVVYAHCDIPCGIYDPHAAQMAAHTVLRMTHLINELNIDSVKDPESKNVMHQVSRLQKVKEEHAEAVKHQIRIIWGDYFKSEYVEKYKEVLEKTSLRSSSSKESTAGLKDLHNMVFKIMKTASKARQEINEDACNELVKLTQDFAEIFWSTKDRKIKRVASGYPTGGEIIIPE